MPKQVRTRAGWGSRCPRRNNGNGQLMEPHTARKDLFRGALNYQHRNLGILTLKTGTQFRWMLFPAIEARLAPWVRWVMDGSGLQLYSNPSPVSSPSHFIPDTPPTSSMA